MTIIEVEVGLIKGDYTLARHHPVELLQLELADFGRGALNRRQVSLHDDLKAVDVIAELLLEVEQIFFVVQHVETIGHLIVCLGENVAVGVARVYSLPIHRVNLKGKNRSLSDDVDLSDGVSPLETTLNHLQMAHGLVRPVNILPHEVNVRVEAALHEDRGAESQVEVLSRARVQQPDLSIGLNDKRTILDRGLVRLDELDPPDRAELILHGKSEVDYA